MQIASAIAQSTRLVTSVVLTIYACVAMPAQPLDRSAQLYAFTSADIAFLTAFSLSSLPPLPSAPSNKYADSIAVAKFGKILFFDRRLSREEKFSCASCHNPKKYFSDGLALGKAHGTSGRGTPTLLGAAWSPWQYWDGRKDSLWSQALAPIEHSDEMGLDRTSFVNALWQFHRADYETLFGEVSPIATLGVSATPLGNSQQIKHWHEIDGPTRRQINRIFVNAGKALMAYQRQLRMRRSRFDIFVDALIKSNPSTSDTTHLSSLLSKNEVNGMRLFMGKANCASCHNGPLFTNFEFHNIGVPEPNPEAVDLGRYSGVMDLVADEFTCLSEWSDAGPGQCDEMRFLKRTGAELVGAFKTPTLRNISQTEPYMQAGQFKTLQDVLSHYNLPTPPFYDREQHPFRPHFDLLPLKLNEDEMADIIAFLATLTSPYPTDDPWWTAPPR